MLVKRKIIKINEELCDGCGNCVLGCAEGAIKIIDGKAKLVSDNLCDGLGACMGACPQNALEIIEREAFEFDEEAVKDHLEKKTKTLCKSLNMADFKLNGPLKNWPVQISLVSYDSNVFEDSDLLIAADCVPAACSDFHKKIACGKKLMIGCPKLDNTEEYIKKLKEIFVNNNLKSLSLARMEVPCCSKMEAVLKESIKLSGKNISFNTITISRDGRII
jgi:NAD-dependent dihydropyrimidine dehydrogenase PreA subunit